MRQHWNVGARHLPSHEQDAWRARNRAKSATKEATRTGAGSTHALVWKNETFWPHKSGPWEYTKATNKQFGAYYDAEFFATQGINKLEGLIDSGVIAFPRYVSAETAKKLAREYAELIGAPVHWSIDGGESGIEYPSRPCP